jgi:hypothetical protein
MLTLVRATFDRNHPVPPPSSWWPDGSSAIAVCPNGHAAALADHEIRYDGVVTPSVGCPEDGCGFHDYVELDGWDP